jgi:hypothetical protein
VNVGDRVVVKDTISTISATTAIGDRVAVVPAEKAIKGGNINVGDRVALYRSNTPNRMISVKSTITSPKSLWSLSGGWCQYIEDASRSWATDQMKGKYIEMVDGTNKGKRYEILSNTTTRYYLTASIETLVSNGDFEDGSTDWTLIRTYFEAGDNANSTISATQSYSSSHSWRGFIGHPMSYFGAGNGWVNANRSFTTAQIASVCWVSFRAKRTVPYSNHMSAFFKFTSGGSSWSADLNNGWNGSWPQTIGPPLSTDWQYYYLKIPAYNNTLNINFQLSGNVNIHNETFDLFVDNVSFIQPASTLSGFSVNDKYMIFDPDTNQYIMP